MTYYDGYEDDEGCWMCDTEPTGFTCPECEKHVHSVGTDGYRCIACNERKDHA